MNETNFTSAIREALSTGGHSGAPLCWERLTWSRIAALKEAGTTTALLPIGALEQHGPHLPLNTDNAIATSVCHYASARTGVPVLPCIGYTNSLGHTDQWPGTLSSTPVTLITLVRELTSWLVRAGWERLLLVNSHYGNDAPLRCAIDYLRTDYRGQLSVGLQNTWSLSGAATDFYQADGADIHANRAETSLMLALDPDAVGDFASADDPDRTDGCVFTWTVADTSRNGVTGRPSEASRAEGVQMLASLGEDLTAAVERARTEQSPLSSC